MFSAGLLNMHDYCLVPEATFHQPDRQKVRGRTEHTGYQADLPGLFLFSRNIIMKEENQSLCSNIPTCERFLFNPSAPLKQSVVFREEE